MSNIHCTCSDTIINTAAECGNFPAAESKLVFLTKKGMATKAFLKNVQSGNNKNLQKQITKGTVKVFTP